LLLLVPLMLLAGVFDIPVVYADAVQPAVDVPAVGVPAFASVPVLLLVSLILLASVPLLRSCCRLPFLVLLLQAPPLFSHLLCCCYRRIFYN
jgi:hypothetical protein